MNDIPAGESIRKIGPASPPITTEFYAPKSRGADSDPGDPLFRDVGTNVLKSRLRSHPDVAEPHYLDLLTKDFIAA